MALEIKIKDRSRGNLKLAKSTLSSADSVVLEEGQSISYDDFIAIISSLASSAWGSITGDISTQADLWAILEGLQANLDSLLTAGYITSEAVDGVFVPFTGTTADLDFGTTQKIVSKNQSAKDSSGIIFKNNTGGTVLVLGISGGRATTFYGNMLPDTDASRDIGQVASSLQNPNNVYVARSIIINPTVNVTAVSMMDILTDATNKIGQIIKAKASHTANLSEWRDSANALLAKVTNAGHFIPKHFIRLTSSYVVTNNNSTFNTVPGFSVDVEAGKSYEFEAFMFVSLGTSVGGKFGIGGTCSATTIRVYGDCQTTSGLYDGAVTAMGQVFIAGAASTKYARLRGCITVNAAGTLTVTFCQYVFSATSSSVLTNSTFKVQQLD